MCFTFMHFILNAVSVESIRSLYFDVNTTHIQCFNVSVDLSLDTPCSSFNNCTKGKFTLSLTADKESNRVYIDKGKSTANVSVQVPERCGCSEHTPSPTSNATTTAIVLVAVFVFCVLSISVIIILLYRKLGHR